MKQVRYTDEQRSWALEQMAPPHNRAVVELARESGVTSVTLRTWRNSARATGALMPGSSAGERWCSADKFRMVLESAPLSEAELSEYCRAKGIHLQQLQQWRQACEQANAGNASPSTQAGRMVSTTTLERIRSLEKELRRKNAALAETAALLVLRKKAAAIWGKEEDA